MLEALGLEPRVPVVSKTWPRDLLPPETKRRPMKGGVLRLGGLAVCASPDRGLKLVQVDTGNVGGSAERRGIDAALYTSVKSARVDRFVATDQLASGLDTAEARWTFDTHNVLLQATALNALRGEALECLWNLSRALN
jgi:hypothetical protein